MIDDNAQTGKNWAKNMVGLLQNVIFTTWEGRNKCLHKNEDKNYITKETELLNSKVHNKYNKGLDGLHPDYHDVFAPDEEEVKQFKIPEKKRWLETVEVYRKRARVDNFQGNTRIFFLAQDEVNYRKRSARLKKSSRLQYYKWWM